MNGEAVCRHIATMLKEIYNAYGIEGNTLANRGLSFLANLSEAPEIISNSIIPQKNDK